MTNYRLMTFLNFGLTPILSFELVKLYTVSQKTIHFTFDYNFGNVDRLS